MSAKTVTISGREFIREGDEWMLWCDCGDLIPLDEVIHDHCANCHAICPSTPDEVNEGQMFPPLMPPDNTSPAGWFAASAPDEVNEAET